MSGSSPSSIQRATVSDVPALCTTEASEAGAVEDLTPTRCDLLALPLPLRDPAAGADAGAALLLVLVFTILWVTWQ